MKVNFSCENIPLKNKVTRSAYGAYFLIAVLFLMYKVLAAFGLLSFMPPLVNEIVSSIVIQILFLLFISLFVFSGTNKIKVKETVKYFGYKKMPAKSWLIAILLGVVVFFLNLYVGSFFSSILHFFDFRTVYGQLPQSYSVGFLFLNLLLSCVLPALCEETAHRGMLLKSSLSFGALKAIIFSSILFGLIHMNIQQTFYATIIGFYLGYIALHTDSIWPCVIIHFMNNALNTFMGFAYVNKFGIYQFFENLFAINTENAVLGVIVNIVFVLLLIFCLIYLTKKIVESTSGARVKNLEKKIYNDIVKQEYMDNIDRSKKAVTGQLQDSSTETYFLNVEDLFFDKNVDLGYMTDFEKKILKDKNKYTFDVWTLTFLSLSIVLGVVATVITLVCGLV